MKTKKLVIFASGSGSNAENIIKYFQENELAKVVLVLCNNPKAKILDRCKKLKISSLCFNRQAFSATDHILKILTFINPDLIILAGFLWKIPIKIIERFPGKIINIHPALLPQYGGKGMYGRHVHEAVVANKETETGITIHYVDEYYDEGAIIFQKRIALDKTDTPQDVADKIHQLEMSHFPIVIEQLLNS